MATLQNPYEEDDPLAALIKQSMAGPGGTAVDPNAPPEQDQENPVEPGVVELPGAPPPDANGVPPVDYTKRGQYADKMGPWSAESEKSQRPWADQSERYKMLSVLSHFDPSKGYTPEVIAALNGADIDGMKFSGSGQHLSIDDVGRNTRVGKGGRSDAVQGFASGNGTWLPWSDPALEGQSSDGGGDMTGGGDEITPTLGLDQGGVPSDEGFFNQLMDALQKAQGGNVDRKALLERMGM